MEIIFFATLALALLVGVYGLRTSLSNVFPLTTHSIWSGGTTMNSSLPLILFITCYTATFYPGVTSAMSIKNKEASIVLHSDMGGQLEPVDAIPTNAPIRADNISLSCQMVQLDIDPPHSIIEENSEAEWLTGFLVEGVTIPPFILVNVRNQIEIWPLTPERTSFAGEKRKLAGINQDGTWKNFEIVDAAVVTNTKLIIAVTFWSQRPDNALYLVDLKEMLLTQILSKGAAHSTDFEYFEAKPISADTGIVLFYSNRVRAAAEIYHNYTNHLMLVSPKYPTGAELIKLGIDIGNIKEWDLYNRSIYMKTIDGRTSNVPREGQWLLDISSML